MTDPEEFPCGCSYFLDEKNRFIFTPCSRKCPQYQAVRRALKQLNKPITELSV